MKLVPRISFVVSMEKRGKAELLSRYREVPHPKSTRRHRLSTGLWALLQLTTFMAGLYLIAGNGPFYAIALLFGISGFALLWFLSLVERARVAANNNYFTKMQIRSPAMSIGSSSALHAGRSPTSCFKWAPDEVNGRSSSCRPRNFCLKF
jgi:hypothetical protein